MKKLLVYKKMFLPIIKAVIKKMEIIDYIKLALSILFICFSIPALYFLYVGISVLISSNSNYSDSTIVLIILLSNKIIFILILLDNDLNRTKKKFLEPIINVYLKDEVEGIQKSLKRIKVKNLVIKEFKLNRSYGLFEVNSLTTQITSYIVLIFFARNLAQSYEYTTNYFSEFFELYPFWSFLLILLLLIYNMNINGIVNWKQNLIFGCLFGLISFIIVYFSAITYLLFTVFMVLAIYRSVLYIVAKKYMKNKSEQLLSNM